MRNKVKNIHDQHFVKKIMIQYKNSFERERKKNKTKKWKK